MNTEEIIKGLECCSIKLNCDGCPCYVKGDDCQQLTLNALNLIEKLIKENNDLRESKCDHCVCELPDERDRVLDVINKLKVKVKNILEEASIMGAIKFLKDFDNLIEEMRKE